VKSLSDIQFVHTQIRYLLPESTHPT